MISMVNFDSVCEVIKLACFSPCGKRKQFHMEQLQQFEEIDGFVTALTQIINVQGKGASMETDSRHLASILLKNVASKHWYNKKDEQNPVKLISDEEKDVLRNFLANYLTETECKIANQLAILTGKILQFDWPQKWPELIPSLILAIQKENDLLLNMRAMMTMNEILVALHNKTQCCVCTKALYNQLCVQLYPIISKSWASSFRQLQIYLSSIPLNTASEACSAVFGSRVLVEEIKVYYIIKVCNVLKLIIENSYTDISVKYANTFKCFWKTFINTFQLISSFLRNARPLTNQLIQQAIELQKLNPASYAQNNSNRKNGEKSCAASKIDTACEEDIDSTCDYYLPECVMNEHNSGLFKYLNLILKLLKSLTCTPVILLRIYPVEMVPNLEPLLQFYYSHLLCEFNMPKTHNAQPICPDNSTGNVQGDSCPAMMRIMTPNNATSESETQQFLPLHYLTMSSNFMLSTVLSNSYYSTPSEGMEASKAAAINTALVIRGQFFNRETVATIMSILLNHTLSFKDTEFNEWFTEGEQFYIGQANLTECSTIKTGSEALFSALLEAYPEQVGGIIIPLLQDRKRQCTMSRCADSPIVSSIFSSEMSLQVMPHREVLFYDAVYLCTGLGVSQLATQMGEPGVWLQTIVGPFIHSLVEHNCNSSSNGSSNTMGVRLLLSRLMWMVSVYSNQFTHDSIYCLFDLFIAILSPNSKMNDVVVKLHAVTSLSMLINLPNFMSSELVTNSSNSSSICGSSGVVARDNNKLINSIILIVQSSCVFVANALQETESKLTVLGLIQESVQLLGGIQSRVKFNMILPLGEYLFELWRVTEECDPIRATLLEIFADLVRAGNAHSYVLHSTLLPIINYSCSVAHSGRNNGYLLKDGLTLWLAVMRNCCNDVSGTPSGYTTSLNELFYTTMNNIFHRTVNGVTCCLLECPNSSEIVTSIMLIVEAYAIVGGNHFIAPLVNQNVLFYLFSTVIGKVGPRTVQYVTRPLEMLLVSEFNGNGTATTTGSNNSATSNSSSRVAAEFLLHSGILVSILRISYASCACQLLSGMFSEYQESDVALLHYITFLSRVMLTHPDIMLNAFTNLKNDIIAYLCKVHNTSSMDCNLSETILLTQYVQLMLTKYSGLEYLPGSILRQKLWCLALLSLYPSSNNGSNNSSNSSDNSGTTTVPNGMHNMFGLCPNAHNNSSNNSGNITSNTLTVDSNVCFWTMLFNVATTHLKQHFGCPFEAAAKTQQLANNTNSNSNSNSSRGNGQTSQSFLLQQRYVYGEVVTLDLLVKWLPDISQIAKQLVLKLGVTDSVDSFTTATNSSSSNSKSVALNSRQINQLIGTEQCEDFGDLQQEVEVPECSVSFEDTTEESESIVRYFTNVMLRGDGVIRSNVNIVMANKLVEMKTRIGDDAYRQLNIH